MDAKLCTVANKMPQLQGLELHAMCFVFKTAVVFLCKERLRQKKKSLIVSLTKKSDKILTTKLTFCCLKGSSSKSSAAEVEIIRYQVLIHGSRDYPPLFLISYKKKLFLVTEKIFFVMQVLIPVTEVQVRASNPKDVDSHYLWELIHLKSQIQRRNEKVYHLSNR